ncbi:MAG: GtrA family protein [Thiothrix sp.]|uniref:GtrA family protein n=1 Tax=Thiothrix sp. TaxID=1032 RepID=UPI0026312BE3|nr:GtrA family protein [Thiothrix sp.]MDD5395597.1 GtrA family protein [Thiothrix sp.]
MSQKIANIVNISSQHKSLGDVASIFFRWLRRSEFLRYFVVSLIALSLDLGAFSASLRLFGLPWVAAATIGFVVGLLVAYILSVCFVFAKRKLRQAPLAELLAFSLVGLGGLGVTQIVLWIGIERLQINPELSKLCAAGFTFIFNFVVRKLMLFNAKAENRA